MLGRNAVTRVPAKDADRPRAVLARHPWTRPPDALLIRGTLAEIAPVSGKVTSYFYALLFVRRPELRALFPPAMDVQRDRLPRRCSRPPSTSTPRLPPPPFWRTSAGGTARTAPAPSAVRRSASASSRRSAPTPPTPGTRRPSKAAWIRACTTVSQMMIDAAAEDEPRAPAWWYAAIVAHDRRTPDVAVLTLRPTSPAPSSPGSTRAWRRRGGPGCGGTTPSRRRPAPTGC